MFSLLELLEQDASLQIKMHIFSCKSYIIACIFGEHEVVGAAATNDQALPCACIELMFDSSINIIHS